MILSEREKDAHRWRGQRSGEQGHRKKEEESDERRGLVGVNDSG